MDWQEVGEQVYEWMKEQREASFQKRIEFEEVIGPSTLIDALIQASRGRNERLIEYLLSDKESSTSWSACRGHVDMLC